uniref:Uncharacterized protein n=1 Tax=Chenopodium quinoa TaxID=63459 RepID=A0A803NEA9_CHEQI
MTGLILSGKAVCCMHMGNFYEAESLLLEALNKWIVVPEWFLIEMGTVAIDAAQLASEHQSANRRGQRMKTTMKNEADCTFALYLNGQLCQKSTNIMLDTTEVKILCMGLLFAAYWSAVLPAVCCCGCAAVFSAALMTSCSAAGVAGRGVAMLSHSLLQAWG